MNIAGWIEKWALIAPEKIALRFDGEEISYPEFNERIKASARMLKHELGVKAGDRIAYLGENHPQILYFVFACARLGVIFIPLNWRLAAKEHLYMLQDSGARILFVADPYIEQCEVLKKELPACQFIAAETKRKTGWPLLSDYLSAAQGNDFNAGVTLDYPLMIIYTSGTTGFPKGAVLTQEAILYNALNSTVMHDMTSQDVILTFLPLFHVGGMNNQTSAGFHAGATVILHKVFDPAGALHALVNDRPTLTIILPAHMPAFAALPGWKEADLSSLRSVHTGSTTIPDEMVSFWNDQGIPLLQMYGSTETCPIAIHQRNNNAYSTAGAIGYPAMHCEIRLIDEEGNDCDIDVPGEILVRGKNVMSHYWNNEEATKKNLVDGWYHTGDIATVDNNGCYHFVDRKNEIIISGSENIYPAEIENVLMNHPDILEVSVVGRQDQRWGEVPVAVMATRNNIVLELEQIRAWLQDKLGKYKHPRALMLVDALPRNAMRKIEKNVVREIVNGKAGSGGPDR